MEVDLVRPPPTPSADLEAENDVYRGEFVPESEVDEEIDPNAPYYGELRDFYHPQVEQCDVFEDCYWYVQAQEPMNFCYCTGLSILLPTQLKLGHFLQIFSITRNYKPYLVSFNLITMCMMTTPVTWSRSGRKTLPTWLSSHGPSPAHQPAQVGMVRSSCCDNKKSQKFKTDNKYPFLYCSDKKSSGLRQISLLLFPPIFK